MTTIDIAEKLQEYAAEWVKRGNVNYRMYKMSSLQWTSFIVGQDKHNGEFEIGGSLIACGCNGGPIAVMNRKGNFISGATNLLKDHIVIFNACGNRISQVAVSSCFDFSGEIRGKRCVLSIQLKMYWWYLQMTACCIC
jgi:hypothetical protein